MANSANARDQVRTAGHGQSEARATSRTLRVLAVVDRSQSTGKVVKYLLGLQSLLVPFEVVLLNIQPQPDDWRLRGYGWFKREAIRERIISDLAQPAIASAGRQLDSAGVKHKDRIELGEAADTIVRCSREEDCDLIVLAETVPGAVRRWLMRSAGVTVGSVASTVIALANVPVVVAH
jgi:nucleotide-binding universal stress UspA family protein